MSENITNSLIFNGDPQIIRDMLMSVHFENPAEHNIPPDVNTIDFNKIIPQPDDQLISDPGQTKINLSEWNIANWGTKCNSYGYSVYGSSETELHFESADAAPHPIIRKLSEQYPDVTILHRWASENIGQKCGEQTYLNGKIIHENLPNGKSTIDLAVEVKGLMLDELGLVLNATGTDYINTFENEYEVVELSGEPALFTEERMTLNDVPEGTYLYHLWETDNGTVFGSAESIDFVRHAGSIITKSPLVLDTNGRIAFDLVPNLNYTGYSISLDEFLQQEFDISQCDQGMGGM